MMRLRVLPLFAGGIGLLTVYLMSYMHREPQPAEQLIEQLIEEPVPQPGSEAAAFTFVDETTPVDAVSGPFGGRSEGDQPLPDAGIRRSAAAEIKPASFGEPVEEGNVVAATVFVQPVHMDTDQRRLFGWSRVSSASPIVSVGPDVPGKTMEVKGRRVTVEAVVAAPDGTIGELDLMIEHAPPPAAASPKSDLRKRWLSMNKNPGGFTEEEELFRMRWGWDAFAQAQREAAQFPVASR